MAGQRQVNAQTASFWPPNYARVLFDPQGSVEIGVVEDRPQAAYCLAIGPRFIGQDSTHPTKDEGKCGIAPAVQSGFHGGRFYDFPYRKHRGVVREVAGRRQVIPKDVLGVLNGLFNDPVFHGC